MNHALLHFMSFAFGIVLLFHLLKYFFLTMGFSYNKRKNIIELVVLRECTATLDSSVSVLNANPDSDNRDGDFSWPGVMTVKVYELDGMSDHPDLPMAGDTWQLLEIACHSKLAARCHQKPKKGSKPNGSDDNGDMPIVDMRSRYFIISMWGFSVYLVPEDQINILPCLIVLLQCRVPIVVD